MAHNELRKQQINQKNFALNYFPYENITSTRTVYSVPIT